MKLNNLWLVAGLLLASIGTHGCQCVVDFDRGLVDDAGADTDEDADEGTGEDADVDTGEDAGVDTGEDADAGPEDTGTDGEADADPDTDVDVGPPPECEFASDCPERGFSTATCAMDSCSYTCDADYEDCDGDPETGCETLLTETDDCGSCGNECELDNASPACTAGTCTIDTCEDGFVDCDGDPENGCEVEEASDPLNCDGCGNACSATNATPSCVDSACDIGSCDAGFDDCDDDAATGCETDVSSDVSNCGGCGDVCAPDNATPVCMDGACGIATCAAGFADCNSDAADGCEVDLRTTSDCGACEMACASGQFCDTSGGSPMCAASCSLTDCSGSCVDTATDLANCGGCGDTCAPDNAVGVCMAGACTIASCNAGFTDCNTTAMDGCEVDTTSIPDCLACGETCSAVANATPVCASPGGCGIGSCDVGGFADCNASEADGCEANLTTDLADCGSCGDACAPDNATGACAMGSCGIASCDSGFGDCNGAAGDGCEINTMTDINHCGACGDACPAVTGATASCSAGACTYVCNAGLDDCDTDLGTVGSNGCEVSLSTTMNCGACGSACMPPNSSGDCMGSACGVGTCDPGFVDDDGVVSNGCEIDTNTDPLNCGSVGNVCDSTNGVPACAAGMCTITCLAGFDDCNSNPSDGCEVTLGTNADCLACGDGCTGLEMCNPAPTGCNSTCSGTDCSGTCVDTTMDVNNCNGCGTACAAEPNSTVICSASACQYTCTMNFADCDGDLGTGGNGCEVNTQTDPAHCNACGATCGSTPPNAAAATCSAAMCNPFVCLSGFGDCNGDLNMPSSDGCEADLSMAPHCGSCGACGGQTNATATACAGSGMCTYMCNGTFDDCDSDLGTSGGTGCEVDTQADSMNCGGCGNLCEAFNAAGSCALSTCSFMCLPANDTCDGAIGSSPGDNGCEVRSIEDDNNCGDCGDSCDMGGTVALSHAEPSRCAAGVCPTPGIVATCLTGWGDTGGGGALCMAAGGCMADHSGNDNCGACGTVCAATDRCMSSNGTMTGCRPLSPSLPGSPVMGTDCSADFIGPALTGGSWTWCPPADMSTATLSCVKTDDHPVHCGGCGQSCIAQPNSTLMGCSSGACDLACDTGWTDCDMSNTTNPLMPGNGCEINTGTDGLNCGMCGNPCGPGEQCVTGLCM